MEPSVSWENQKSHLGKRYWSRASKCNLFDIIQGYVSILDTVPSNEKKNDEKSIISKTFRTVLYHLRFEIYTFVNIKLT